MHRILDFRVKVSISLEIKKPNSQFTNETILWAAFKLENVRNFFKLLLNQPEIS